MNIQKTQHGTPSRAKHGVAITCTIEKLSSDDIESMACKPWFTRVQLAGHLLTRPETDQQLIQFQMSVL